MRRRPGLRAFSACLATLGLAVWSSPHAFAQATGGTAAGSGGAATGANQQVGSNAGGLGQQDTLQQAGTGGNAGASTGASPNVGSNAGAGVQQSTLQQAGTGGNAGASTGANPNVGSNASAGAQQSTRQQAGTGGNAGASTGANPNVGSNANAIGSPGQGGNANMQGNGLNQAGSANNPGAATGADLQVGSDLNNIASPGTAANGQQFATQFNQRLSNDPILNGSGINATYGANGAVLSGTVPTLAQSLRAGYLADSIYGLSGYQNQINVVPDVTVADAVLLDSLTGIIAQNRLNPSGGLQFAVNNGVVTMSGDAISSRQLEMIRSTVARMPGVVDIRDDTSMMRAGGESHGDTSTIEQRILVAMAADAVIPSQGINVAVAADTVELSGEVNSLAEKRAAVRAAHVSGVRRVVAENLMIASSLSPGEEKASESLDETVEGEPIANEGKANEKQLIADETDTAPPAPQPESSEAPARSGPDDEAVKERVAARLQSNPRLRNDDLQIDVTERIVTVTGRVDTLQERREILSELRSVRGVRDAKLEVEVGEVEEVPDDLAATVRSRLAAVGMEQLEIREARGTVNIEGDVKNLGTKDVALAAVRDTPGVLDVVDNITVMGREEATRDYVDNPYIDGVGAFEMLTKSLTEPGRGTAAPYGGGFAITGGTERESAIAREADLPDGVDASGKAIRGRPLASPGANDAPAAEVTSARPGEEIADGNAEKVTAAIKANPRLKPHDITVREVGEGRMVISGAVDDWFEYSLIRRLAYDAGATDVEMTVTVN